MNVQHLQLGISDAALLASSDGAYGEVELRYSRKFADARLSAMVAAVRAEMIAGFPSGRLFLDSVEQAMAITLVKDHAVRHRPVQIYQGGLGAARLRRIKELVHAKMEDDLSLDEMAQSVGLSTAHFAMRGYWTWPLPVASRPSSTLHRSFVTSGELARQSFARILSTVKRIARLKKTPKIRRSW
jgi:hypothetical protein